jgi:hypothetical protein
MAKAATEDGWVGYLENLGIDIAATDAVFLLNLAPASMTTESKNVAARPAQWKRQGGVIRRTKA